MHAHKYSTSVVTMLQYIMYTAVTTIEYNINDKRNTIVLMILQKVEVFIYENEVFDIFYI